jgi:glycine/D-amino acid oxidase-like deaminating enzyme
MASLGATLQACAPKAAARTQITPPRPMLRLAPVNVGYDRIIRTTIGLRPFRPSGFVLRTEQLDGKTIVHNFGHGGSGMSLSWGTASMATEMAMAHLERKAAVMGSGVVGLTSARELQRHGFDVTIYAATVPPDTTSNMSLAGFTPTSGLVEFKTRTPQWDAQFTQAVRFAYRRLQLLAGPKYGISWIKQYAPTDNEGAGRGTNQLLPADLQGNRVILQPGEHPFPTKYAIEREEMRIEPSIYLDALMNDFLLWGGKVVIRKFETPRDVTTLGENVIVNCTGLGSKALFSDPELTPLKGQLVVLVPQEEVHYGTTGGARAPVTPEAGFVHMMPRSDGIVLGGTSIRDNWSLDIEEKDRQRVIDAHIELFSGLRGTRKT